MGYFKRSVFCRFLSCTSNSVHGPYLIYAISSWLIYNLRLKWGLNKEGAYYRGGLNREGGLVELLRYKYPNWKMWLCKLIYNKKIDIFTSEFSSFQWHKQCKRLRCKQIFMTINGDAKSKQNVSTLARVITSNM